MQSWVINSCVSCCWCHNMLSRGCHTGVTHLCSVMYYVVCSRHLLALDFIVEPYVLWLLV